jgi:hypothetical protein
MSIFSCKKNTFNYKINGAAQGVPDGAKIYLKHLNQNGRELIRDSGVVTDEEFKMNGNIVEPTIHFMSSDKIPGQLIFMLENSVIDINLNNKNLMASKVKGSESNDGFVLFQAGMDSIREQSRNVVLKLRSGGLSSDRKKDSLLKLLEKSSIGMQEYPLKYVEKYNNSYFSLNLISLESNKNNFDIIRFHKAFENLNSKLKNSPKGLKTKRKLDSLMLIIEKK